MQKLTINDGLDIKKLEEYLKKGKDELKEEAKKDDSKAQDLKVAEETYENFKKTDKSKKEDFIKKLEADMKLEDGISYDDLNNKINEEMFKEANSKAHKNGRMDSYLVAFYKNTIGRRNTMSKISGFTATGKAFDLLGSAVGFVVDNTVVNAWEKAKGSQAKFHKWEHVSQEQVLVAQFKSLIYRESEDQKDISHRGSRDLVETVLNTPSILRECNKRPNGQIGKLFKKALLFQMDNLSQDEKVNLYLRVEAGFGENEIQGIKKMSEKKEVKKSIAKNLEVYNLEILSEDIFEGSPLKEEKSLVSSINKDELITDDLLEAEKDAGYMQIEATKLKLKKYYENMGLKYPGDKDSEATENSVVDLRMQISNLKNMLSVEKKIREERKFLEKAEDRQQGKGLNEEEVDEVIANDTAVKFIELAKENKFYESIKGSEIMKEAERAEKDRNKYLTTAKNKANELIEDKINANAKELGLSTVKTEITKEGRLEIEKEKSGKNLERKTTIINAVVEDIIEQKKEESEENIEIGEEEKQVILQNADRDYEKIQEIFIEEAKKEGERSMDFVKINDNDLRAIIANCNMRIEGSNQKKAYRKVYDKAKSEGQDRVNGTKRDKVLGMF